MYASRLGRSDRCDRTEVGWLLLAPTLAHPRSSSASSRSSTSLWLAFHQWNPFGANPDMIFNGADNFRRLVFDTEFLSSLGVTLKFVFFAVLSETDRRLLPRPGLHEGVSRARRSSAPSTPCR